MPVKRNIVEGSSVTEEHGKIIAATEVVFVSTRESPVLIAALDDEDVPQPGAQLNSDNPDVVVVRRLPIIVGMDANKSPKEFTLKVAIDYELQRPEIPVAEILRGGSSLSQIQTSKDKSDVDIVVTSLASEGSSQIATVNVLQPTSNISFERSFQSNQPTLHTSQYIGMVNDATFLNEPKRTWLCTNVSFEIVNETSSPPKYNFTYELEHNPNTWDVSVGFKKDDGTFEASTFVDVEWHEETSFSDLIAT